ncbi:uncharacterized protein [Nicotiana tomentosiformis]|uniref:uncharacterized protein n=1 Tax=Nicotiana tomentosiformis TaxID=4098 RepID=UPI00388CC7EE
MENKDGHCRACLEVFEFPPGQVDQDEIFHSGYDFHTLEKLAQIYIREIVRLHELSPGGKSYADKKVDDVAFMEGEKVLLRVFPMKSMISFEKKEKFSPRFIGSFEVLERVDEVLIDLLCLLVFQEYLVFHGSMLWKYHGDKSHVLDIRMVQLDENLAYEEELLAFFDK